VLVDMNPADMVAALNVPEAKLAKRALDSAAQRVVTLKELLGAAPPMDAIKRALLAGFAERLGIDPVPGQITVEEESLATKYHDEEIGTDAFVAEIDDPGARAGVRSASHTGAGGTITAYVRLEGPRNDRLREVLVTGDFFVTPPRIVLDLEASLRNVPVGDVRPAVERFFGEARVGLLTVQPADFAAAIEAAAAAGA
jgi:lipoate-protein ligase A